jgi:hypothetical protein
MIYCLAGGMKELGVGPSPPLSPSDGVEGMRALFVWFIAPCNYMNF